MYHWYWNITESCWDKHAFNPFKNQYVQTFPFKQKINKEDWRVYFFEVLFHYHFLDGMLHKHLFLYFPHAGLLLFLVRPSLHIRLISWNLMLSNHSYHVPLILEHYRNLRGKHLTFQESIVAKNKQRRRRVYFFEVLFIITF